MQKFNMDDSSSNKYGGMTHFVNLPSGGGFYPEGHPLYGLDKVEVKMMTTKEEDILTNQSYIENGVVLDKLLESILMVDVHPKDMLDADKMAVMIAARVEAYGPEYTVTLTCNKCQNFYLWNVDLSSFEPAEASPDFEKTPGGTFVVELPKSQSIVEFQHLLPNQIESITKTVDKMKSLNINTNFNTEFYKRVILSVNGDDKTESISAFVENMKILDSRKFLKAYQSTVPSMNTNVKSTCSECGHQNEGGMPVQGNFFFPEF